MSEYLNQLRAYLLTLKLNNKKLMNKCRIFS